jgi:hypothetical protein
VSDIKSLGLLGIRRVREVEGKRGRDRIKHLSIIYALHIDP